MDKLQLPHAKLFYYSAELYKNGKISDSEKIKLKELVINDDPRIFEYLERYLKRGDEQDFINDLMYLLGRAERPSSQIQQQNSQNQNQNNIIANSSTSINERIVVQPVKQQNDNDYADQINLKLKRNQEDSIQQSNQRIENHQLLITNQDEVQKLQKFVEENPTVPDEISSPLGVRLFKRKIQQEKNHTKEVKSYLKPFNTMDNYNEVK